MDRPALQRLLRDVESGRIDVIVVYKVDRLSRSLTDFARIIEVFDKHNASFVSITQQFNTTTSMGRLTLNILLSFAQFEREVIGERIRDKFAASRARGIWMGGVPPLGYDVVERKLVVNEIEAEMVQTIFRRFLKLGSATMLAQELRRAGHTTKSWTTQDGKHRPGKPIDKGAIYKILNNRVYLGDAVHKGTPHPGEHEAIIDRATWDKVHTILAENAVVRANGTRAQMPALLRGLIFAPGGRAMTPSHSRKNGRLYRYYVSTDAIRQGYSECAVRSVPAAEVEEAVVSQVRHLLQTPEIIARTWAAVIPNLMCRSARSSGPSRTSRRCGMSSSGRAGADRPAAGGAGRPRAGWHARAAARRRAADAGRAAPHNGCEGARRMRANGRSAKPDWRFDGKIITVRIPMTFVTPRRPPGDHRVRRRRRLGACQAAPDDTLIRALARAHRWKRMLEEGRYRSAGEIAEAEGVTRSFVNRLLRLTLLAPEIVEAIIDGRHRKGMQLEGLTRPLPSGWEAQRASAGARPAAFVGANPLIESVTASRCGGCAAPVTPWA